MEKRVIIAIILCVGVLAAWSKLMPTPTAPPPAPTSAAVQAPAPAPTAPATAPPGAPGAGSTTPEQPEQEIDVVTKDVHYVFSTMGGTLKHARLTDATFLERK